MMESKPHTNSVGGTYWKSPDGRYHRLDGPAIIWADGHKEWWINDKRHRLDGPAVIWEDGTKRWCINGFNVTEQIHEWANDMNIDLDNLTDEDKFMIRLYWENYSE